jgi:uncharacterized membrane protein
VVNFIPKKTIALFLIGVLIFVYFQKAKTETFLQEAIISFNSAIVVNIDNSIDVTETIVYDTGSEYHHGIYRDIYTFSSQGRKMKIENIKVTDENGNPYQLKIYRWKDNIRIIIGDPQKTFNGQKTYVIKYRATKAVAQFKDFDEIYWNVTGNGWNMPIYKAETSLVLPYGVKMIQAACYYGPEKSTSQCKWVTNEDGSYTFKTPSTYILGPYEGLTVAIGFSKGAVHPYSSDNVSDFLDRYWPWLVSATLPILTFIFSFINWYKKGRDARGSGVIVPQYDVPENLTPMEVSGIVNEKVTVDDIPAEIIYLATKGYLKIQELGERFVGLEKITDYKFIKLKDFSDLPNEFDKEILNAIFKHDLPVIKLSDLKYTFYIKTESIIVSVLDALLNKGYYKNLGKMERLPGFGIFFVFFTIWSSLFFGSLIGTFLLKGYIAPVTTGIFLSFIIYGIISYFSPAKTKKGALMKEYLLGLKDYLQIAEKDRLQFHNAPEKKPEIFEKLLPYAMVLGVADVWAKEFEGLLSVPPSWYSGPAGTTFNSVLFSSSMNKFGSSARGYLSSSPHSGSGGHGFSGGGGGGGGGGSW